MAFLLVKDVVKESSFLDHIIYRCYENDVIYKQHIAKKYKAIVFLGNLAKVEYFYAWDEPLAVTPPGDASMGSFTEERQMLLHKYLVTFVFLL